MCLGFRACGFRVVVFILRAAGFLQGPGFKFQSGSYRFYKDVTGVLRGAVGYQFCFSICFFSKIGDTNIYPK